MATRSDLQAIILVGGEGTRLRPLTYGTPKPMVPLLGVPFLERTLYRLHEAGIDDVVLAAGYMPKAITEHLGDGSRLGMRLTYVIEASPLGTAGALRNVAELIHGTFFVLNGDVLTSLDLRAMLACHREKGGVGVLHLIRVEDPSAFGCVVHDAAGRVTQFVEKPGRGEAPTDEVNAGTYLLERSVLDAIPQGRNVSIERETFPRLLAADAALYAYVTEDYWLDLGRPEHYIQAHRDVLAGKLRLAPSADPAASSGSLLSPDEGALHSTIRPPVYAGEGATIDASAVVGPYTVLGERSHVGPEAEVRGSVLWDGVVVSGGARVYDAILASNVRVGRGAVVEPGAVIGHDVEIDAGSIVEANARIAVVQPAET
ncbi:MAG: NDP-sugar synthase [Candidatus Baltobacteraceae bacterium]|jgi:mannose-1-phosphate guanylyltransferase